MGVEKFSLPQDVQLLGASRTIVRLEYPKNGRLLLGTTTNLQQSGALSLRDLISPIEISVVCRGLYVPPSLFDSWICRTVDRPDKVRPYALFFNRTVGMNNEWKFIGRTETIYYDKYHRFTSRIRVDLQSSLALGQEIRVEIYSQPKKAERTEEHLFLGVVCCSLEDIISERLLRKELPLVSPRVSNAGSVLLSADIVKTCPRMGSFCIKLSISPKAKRRQRSFYVLSRKMYGGDFVAMYRSEVIGRREGQFEAFRRDARQLPVDDVLRLEVFQFSSKGQHVELGFVQTSVENLKVLGPMEHLLWWPLADGEGPRTMNIGRVVMTEGNVEARKLEFHLRMMT